MNVNGRNRKMNCEEFDAIGLGMEREGTMVNDVQAAERAAALEHANTCSRCAALLDSWQEARLGLQALRGATHVETPARVEMRLRQEFRTRHRTLKVRSRLLIGAWTLAAAAVLFGFVSWWTWHKPQNGAGNQTVALNSGAPPAIAAADTTNSADTLLADNEGDFTLLPGSLPQETQDAAIVRVRLQRGALADFGLPVNEDRANEWIQVDLLVGDDGQPRAVRLPATSSD
jgi:hypothetical protein